MSNAAVLSDTNTWCPWTQFNELIAFLIRSGFFKTFQQIKDLRLRDCLCIISPMHIKTRISMQLYKVKILAKTLRAQHFWANMPSVKNIYISLISTYRTNNIVFLSGSNPNVSYANVLRRLIRWWQNIIRCKFLTSKWSDHYS